MKFIGDVHGRIADYLEIVKSTDDYTFQVGDMAVGFPNIWLPAISKRDFFIRGNHDDPAVCRIHPNYAGEYGYKAKFKLFYASGAWSIDRAYRQAYEDLNGIKTWWQNEELTIGQFRRAREIYLQHKPEIVVTHDCPEKVGEYVLRSMSVGGEVGYKHPTSTGAALQTMFSLHQPKIWIFGHWHVDRDFEMEGTRFICLNELKTFTI